MAVRQRGFQEIDISICSAILGKSMVPSRSEWQSERPQLWRSNLIALSQYHNLFFKAIWSEIHVYRPRFPSQELQSRPIFSFPLGTSGLSLPGFIDETCPHAANQILVGDLGKEEILVCVCDDGDVIVYTTRSIVYAIEKQSAYQGSVEAGLPYVKPFFINNVHKSAWGISIHKEARLLAVSANTHIITVFAFALEAAVSSDADTSSEHDRNRPKDNPRRTYPELRRTAHSIRSSLLTPPDRSVNRKIELCGHRTNIPNITFCNTDDDKDGKYLTSIDISGLVSVWDVWRQERLGSFKPQYKAPDRGMSGSSRPYGWNVLCLDVRAFRPADTQAQLFGCEARCNFSTWDIGASRRDVKDSSALHPSLEPTERNIVAAHADTFHGEEDFDESIRETDEEDIDDDLMDMDIATEDFVHEHDDLGSSDAATNEDTGRSAGALQGFVSAFDGHSISTRPYTISLERTPPTTSDLSDQLPFLLLSMTDEDLLLKRCGSDLPPTILRRVLVQELPPQIMGLSNFERLNMAAQIPELGIVIVASQAGRVALLTLTTRRGSKKGRDFYAFRLDWILPFKSQEDQELRPVGPLHGMAVSPIQGQQSRLDMGDDNFHGRPQNESWRAVESSRRYRLMLMYYDRSVLSYEIGRTSEGTNGGELLVF